MFLAVRRSVGAVASIGTIPFHRSTNNCSNSSRSSLWILGIPTMRHFSSSAVRNNRNRRFKHLNPLTPENAVNPLSKPLQMDAACLHVVSVPIGNIKDFTVRALEVLRQCDYIVSTNRNATKALLQIVDIDFAGRLIHFQPSPGPEGGINAQRIVDMLRGGRSMALVSPAGTPCVGDEGAILVRAMVRNGVRVSSVPGPCSIVAALSVSGSNADNAAAVASKRLGTAFASGSFFFGSHVADRPGPRARQLRQVRDFSCPAIFYDVPTRLVATLVDMAAIFDGPPPGTSPSTGQPKRAPRRITVLHEMTKVHEAMHTGTAQGLLSFYTQMRGTKSTQLGQLVIVVHGVDAEDLAAEDAMLFVKQDSEQANETERLKSPDRSEQSYFSSGIFGKGGDGESSPNNGKGYEHQERTTSTQQMREKNTSTKKERALKRRAEAWQMLSPEEQVLLRRRRKLVCARRAAAAAIRQKMIDDDKKPTPLP